MKTEESSGAGWFKGINLSPLNAGFTHVTLG